MITRLRLTFAYLAVVLAATLVPAPEPTTAPAGVGLCLICGSRGVADALMNALFFAPLGLLLWRRLGWKSVAAGAALSAAIEVAQLWIPGRFSTVGDLVFNSAGVALGGAIGWAWSRGLFRPAAPWSRRLAIGWAFVLWASLTGGALLLRPAVPARPLYGQWTAEMDGLELYRGRVLEARVAGIEARDGLLERSARIGAALEREGPVSVRFVAGPPPPGPAPIFSIYDDRQRRILFVGADRDDLRISLRRHADELRLDRPEIRFEDALAGVSPGDTLGIDLERVPRLGVYRLSVTRSVAGSPGKERVATSVEGFTLARTWSLLLFSGSLLPGLIFVLDLAWLTLLGLPAGWWSSGWKSLTVVGGGGYLAGLGVLPHLTSTRPTRASEYVAAVAGLLLGRWLSDRAVTSSQRSGVTDATNDDPWSGASR